MENLLLNYKKILIIWLLMKWPQNWKSICSLLCVKCYSQHHVMEYLRLMLNFLLQITLTEKYIPDHDLSFVIHYHNPYVPTAFLGKADKQKCVFVFSVFKTVNPMLNKVIMACWLKHNAKKYIGLPTLTKHKHNSSRHPEERCCDAEFLPRITRCWVPESEWVHLHRG